jgi:hypothetical protein
MYEEVLLNDYNAEAERTLSTCDAYDVKASIWLAVIIFLGTQTAYLIEQTLSPCLKWGQFLSASLLVLGGVVTLIELRPREYRRYSPSNGVIEKWLSRLRADHAGEEKSETVISNKITIRKLTWLKEMIIANKDLNEKKARLLLLAFWSTAAAATINIVTIALIRLLCSLSR